MTMRTSHLDLNVSDRPAAYGAFVLRLALGVMWIAHALLKLFTFTLSGTAAFFSSVGLPGALAYPVFAAELIGGIAILIGFHGRIASLTLMPILAVATWVHLPNGWAHTSPGGGWEYPLFLLAASLAHGVLGDGAFAISRVRLPASRAESGTNPA